MDFEQQVFFVMAGDAVQTKLVHCLRYRVAVKFEPGNRMSPVHRDQLPVWRELVTHST